ncbi:MAG: GIY-YIG nuclease family protein, partial [Lutibacter sp.]|nr:GIY-YIG nuclease family protein [Lutibacter sp.]
KVGDEQFVLSEIGFNILNNEKCSGIYILEFKNNEYYIGQAKKIQIRIKQHHKKYNDIQTIYFKPIIESQLLLEENNTIWIFETNKLRIRNLKQVSFLNIFNESNQYKWITNINFNSLTGSKFDNETVREKFKDRFLILKEKPYFEELLSLLSKYLKSAIPNYLASEFNYWNITCLPNYMKEANCVSRININAVPVLSVFEEPDKSLTFMVYASKLPYLKYLNKNGVDSFLDQIPTLRLDLRDAFWEKTEGDEISILINQENFQNALDNQLVLSSIRLFNLRMMNNVGNELKYRRTTFHCLDFSDLIINHLLIEEQNKC